MATSQEKAALLKAIQNKPNVWTEVYYRGDYRMEIRVEQVNEDRTRAEVISMTKVT